MDTNIVKSVQVMRWMNTLSNVSAGHDMDEHIVRNVCRSSDGWTNTQSVVISNSIVMRWMNTNTVIVSNVSAGDEMDEHKYCQMRWMDTLSKVQVVRWMNTNTVKCLQVMR